MHIQSLSIDVKQHTVITGFNGSGKSSLAAVLAGAGQVTSGERQLPSEAGWVSISQQQAIIEAERKKDDADILDVIPVPSTAKQIILQPILQPNGQQLSNLHALTEMLGVAKQLEQPFLSLSTGETRKVLLIQQLLREPDLLILDEPFDGLDASSTLKFTDYLAELQKRCTLVLVINRLSELPNWAQKLVLMQNNRIKWQSEGRTLCELDQHHLSQIFHIQHSVIELPPADPQRCSPVLSDPSAPLVNLINGHMRWGDKTVFEALNWQISVGEHWQIVGPNGSGKTCLLNLITGDNPMCYRNNLTVFGYHRGSGESIWDIKQHIGLVSNGLHLAYRVNCALLDVVLSGYFDSIGLYQKPTRLQRELAIGWLTTINMAQSADMPFQSLSFGDQRLVLIVRAMVKHPNLLILDEPCLGLDEVNRLKVLAMVELLIRHSRTTVLYVNHHSEDAIDGISHCLDMRDFAPDNGHHSQS